MKNLSLALFALVLAPSLSFAGGAGGSAGEIQFSNANKTTVAVIVSAPKGFDPKRNTLDQFKAAGGRILGPGEKTVFDKLDQGNHKIGVSFVDTTAGKIGKNTSQSVETKNGKGNRVRVRIEGGTGTVDDLPSLLINP